MYAGASSGRAGAVLEATSVRGHGRGVHDTNGLGSGDTELRAKWCRTLSRGSCAWCSRRRSPHLGIGRRAGGGPLRRLADTGERVGRSTGAPWRHRGLPLTMSEHHDLAGLFHSLSPDAQAAALVYGVVDPHVRTTWQVALILRHADIQSQGRRLTSTRLQDAARELVKHGLAYAPRRDEGLRASPHWAPWLTKDRKNNPSIDIVVRVSVWSLSGSMSVRGQTYRGRGDAIWSRRSCESMSGRRCGPGGAGGEAQRGCGAPAGAVRTASGMGRRGVRLRTHAAAVRGGSGRCRRCCARRDGRGFSR